MRSITTTMGNVAVLDVAAQPVWLSRSLLQTPIPAVWHDWLHDTSAPRTTLHNPGYRSLVLPQLPFCTLPSPEKLESAAFASVGSGTQ